MPRKSKKICAEAGCHQKIPGEQRHCPEHYRVDKGGFSGKIINPGREAFYNSKAWRTTRNEFIRLNPMCVKCNSEDVERLADVADHIIDWQEGGDKYSHDNLQGLCHSHHNRKTGRQASAKRGTVTY